MVKPTAAVAASLLCLISACSSSNNEATPSDDTFCAAFEEWMDLGSNLGASASPLEMPLNEVSDPDDFLTADELHTMGQVLLSGADELDSIMDEAIANARDPQVVETLRAINGVGAGVYRWMGEIARDSDSFLEFSMTATEESDVVIALQASYDAIDEVALDQYLSATCPDLYSQFGGASSQAVDTNVKADVATLGKEIATFYVDADPTGPSPEIVVDGGRYLMLGTDIGPVYPGNRITDQYFNGVTDWCVEITNDQGDVGTFSYSAQRGLEAETCR